MAHQVQGGVFGRRKELHTVIIARGDRVRHFQVRPWLAATAMAGVVAMSVGYVLATSYLVLRDDLIGAAAARQARIQQAYEDRISALRSQVDRITSRQLLDQQLMETKVSELIARQQQLTQRHGRIGPILDRIGTAEPPQNAPLPPARPDRRVQEGTLPVLALTGAATAGSPFTAMENAGANGGQSTADLADRLFVDINRSLRTIEDEQLVRISSLAEDTAKTVDTIAETLAEAGLPVDKDYGTGDALGGPLIAVDSAGKFEARVRELDQALNQLEAIKKTVSLLPINNPVPGRAISSGYGIRKDPLIGTPALHSGIDFRAPSGYDALATGSGTIVKAGWNGGYGRMVEIDHGQGLTTRYAHLSRVLVKEGQRIEKGDVIGKVGSSGRSTGPHLHYEIRSNGEAVNPLRFLTAGSKVGDLL